MNPKYGERSAVVDAVHGHGLVELPRSVIGPRRVKQSCTGPRELGLPASNGTSPTLPKTRRPNVGVDFLASTRTAG